MTAWLLSLLRFVGHYLKYIWVWGIFLLLRVPHIWEWVRSGGKFVFRRDLGKMPADTLWALFVAFSLFTFVHIYHGLRQEREEEERNYNEQMRALLLRVYDRPQRNAIRTRLRQLVDRGDTLYSQIRKAEKGKLHQLCGEWMDEVDRFLEEKFGREYTEAIRSVPAKLPFGDLFGSVSIARPHGPIPGRYVPLAQKVYSRLVRLRFLLLEKFD